MNWLRTFHFPQRTATFFRASTPREPGAQSRFTGDAARGSWQAAQDGECWSIQNTERVFRSHIETVFVTSVPHWQKILTGISDPP